MKIIFYKLFQILNLLLVTCSKLISTKSQMLITFKTLCKLHPIVTPFILTNINIYSLLAKFLRITDTHVRLKANMSRLKWPKTELLNSRARTSIEDTRNSSSTRPSKERNVSKLTSNNIKNSTNNGMRISSKPKRKMLKPSVSWKIDTLKRSKRTDRFWRRSFHWHSNSALSSSTFRRSNQTWPNRRSKYNFKPIYLIKSII